MKAVVITDKEKVKLTDIDKPEPKAGEVLLKIKYVGLCGSDLNTYLGRNPMVKLPVIPGHEIGAEIAGTGENVPEGYRAGMTCTVNPYTSCGHCTSCRNNRPNACRYNETLGVQRHGGACEYLVLPWQKVLTDSVLSPKELALVEPMSVGFHAVSRGAVTDNDTVMVIGCGMIGIGAIVRASLRGATVITVDVDDRKLALARRLGAAHTINSRTQEVHEELKRITQDAGPDVVIEAVGSPATYQMAVNEAAFTGRVVCIGYAKSEVSFETKYFVMKELDIRGSRNAMPEDFQAVIRYLKRGTCPKEELISGVFSPGQAKEALDTWAANPGNTFRMLLEF